MKLTRDFHPSQVLLILKVQQYTSYGRSACYSVVVLLMFSLPFTSNNFAKGLIYLSQIATFATGFKLENLKRLISDDHHVVNLSRSTQGISSHLEASFAPPKRDVAIAEYVQPGVIPTHPVLKALHGQKIECQLIGELKSPSFIRTLVKPTNCNASKVLSAGLELQLNLALSSPPIMSISNGAIAIDTPRSDRQIAKFADYWQPTQKIEAAIGVDINNKLVSIDLSHPETCHILAAGTTGSGKSVWLQSLLLSLLIGRSPDELQVILCDPKRVSFFAFKDCANLLVPIIYTPEEVIYVGNWLIAEMVRRYEVFADAEVENIDQYNALPGVKELPRIFFLNDEYGDLKSASSKKQWGEIMNINIRIGQMARASGITESIVTQKAVDVIDKKVRSNLPARILLKVLEEGDTECILGKVTYDGRNLLGRGDLFFDNKRLQSLLCEPSDFAKLTKGRPVYDPDELDPKSAIVMVKSSVISDDSFGSFHNLTCDDWQNIKEDSNPAIVAPVMQKMISFLDGRDWTRDNHIKQSIAEFKSADTPIEEIQGYLQFLEVKGHLETRNAGRNGLEARKIQISAEVL